MYASGSQPSPPSPVPILPLSSWNELFCDKVGRRPGARLDAVTVEPDEECDEVGGCGVVSAVLGVRTGGEVGGEATSSSSESGFAIRSPPRDWESERSPLIVLGGVLRADCGGGGRRSGGSGCRGGSGGQDTECVLQTSDVPERLAHPIGALLLQHQ